MENGGADPGGRLVVAWWSLVSRSCWGGCRGDCSTLAMRRGPQRRSATSSSERAGGVGHDCAEHHRPTPGGRGRDGLPLPAVGVSRWPTLYVRDDERRVVVALISADSSTDTMAALVRFAERLYPAVSASTTVPAGFEPLLLGGPGCRGAAGGASAELGPGGFGHLGPGTPGDRR